VIAIDYIPANKKGFKMSTDALVVIETFEVAIADEVISTQ
jgi:hypothetical protein